MMFNRETALMILTAADMAQRVYDPFKSLAFEQWAGYFDRVETWVEGNAEGMGIVTADTAYIVFRGTEPSKIKDWLSDGAAAPSSFTEFWTGATVHRGFEAYTLCLEDEFRAFASRNTDKRIVVCGHSLGGAAAVLCAALLKGYQRIDQVITFGCPPVGNHFFQYEYNAKLSDVTLRFENNNDLVPVLPGLAPWLCHVSQRLYLPFFGKSVWVDPPQWKYRLDRIAGRLGAAITLNIADGIGDHDMGRYRKKLSKVLSRQP